MPVALAAIAAILPSAVCLAQEEPPKPFGKLKLLQTLSRNDLMAVCCIRSDPSGKFIYTASWRAESVNVFSRDAKTGLVAHVQTVTNPRDMKGATGIALSSDGKYALSSAYRSQAAVLLKRDPQTGKLEFLDAARQDEKGVKGMEWAVDAAFSPDGRFVYIADPKGPGRSDPAADGKQSALTAFEVTNRGRLKWVGTNTGVDNCFNAARGVAFHTDGETILVVGGTPGTLVVLDWEKQTGAAKVRQVIKDGAGGVNALEGAITVTSSPDARHVYVSSGRFLGDNAISVYEMDKNGRLSLVQELFDGVDLKNFSGGNEITVSPDGRNVYAAATGSSSLACLERNPNNGKLTYIETTGDVNGSLRGAAGVCVSPDGKHVYVAVELSNAVSVFARDTGE